MKEFIIYLIKSGICLSIFLLIYQVFLRRNTFFHFNRGYLLLGLVISFIVPIFPYTYNVYIPIENSVTTIQETADIFIPKAFDINIWFVLMFIYIIGILIILIHNIRLIRNLLLLFKSAKKIKTDKYKLIDSDDINAPFSVWNYIVMNRKKLSDKEQELILKHEITHVCQRHWIDLLCSQLLLIFQWFNPIAWKYIKIQKENHEFLADKAVIDAGISPALYRAVLINQQFQGPVFSFSNSFNYSKSLNRLVMMTKTKSSPWKKMMVLTILPLFSIFIWASAKENVVFVDNNSANIKVVPDKKKATLSIVKVGETAKLESNIDLSKYLILIDNKEATIEDTKKLKASGNYVFGIIEDEEAIKKYGEKAKNGVVSITTVGNGVLYNDNTSEIVIGMEQKTSSNIPEDILIIIDGKESSKADMEKLNIDNIESIDVLKDKTATQKYGDKAKNGVIIVKTQKKPN